MRSKIPDFSEIFMISYHEEDVSERNFYAKIRNVKVIPSAQSLSCFPIPSADVLICIVLSKDCYCIGAFFFLYDVYRCAEGSRCTSSMNYIANRK
jgi:hypothetical protein